jgi:uncharacterized protein
MDLNNKNGQPSMEEILASIRRIIAEEPTAANPVIDLHAKYRQKADDDDSNDFELPSIFRPAAPAPERQPLFGRLTDAIRSASTGTGTDQKAPRKSETEGSDSQDRYRGALRESGTILALANGQGGLDGVASNGSHQTGEPERYRGALRDAGGAGSLSSALSSLKLTRGAESSPLGARPDHEPQHHASAAPVSPAPAPVAAAAPVPQAPVAPAPASASGGVEDVRRVMVPFRDMRMSRMATDAPAAPSSPAAEASALDALLYSTPQASEPAPVHHAFVPDFPAPPVQEVYQAPVPPPPQPQAFEESALSLDEMHRFAAVMEPQRPPPPPPPVAAAPSDSGAGAAIEDTTADLLRPMLRQWLSENMPRMVEKALSIELAESVKSNRKFNGS